MTSLVKIAQIFGIVFLAIGVLGFIPPVAPNGMLLGIFHVNAAHNFVHLLSGAMALAASTKGSEVSKLYFQIFGVVYGLVAILGFFVGHGEVLGIIANNPADTYLHIAISAASLYLGFAYKTPKIAL